MLNFDKFLIFSETRNAQIVCFLYGNNQKTMEKKDDIIAILKRQLVNLHCTIAISNVH